MPAMPFDRSIKIAPSILSADFAALGAEIAAEALGWTWEIVETTRALGPNVNPYSRFRLMLGDEPEHFRRGRGIARQQRGESERRRGRSRPR